MRLKGFTEIGSDVALILAQPVW